MRILPVVKDPVFDGYFRSLQQVFLYVTDECNLRCTQCYYKPWLKPLGSSVEMDFDVACALLGKFRSLGAIKASFLGGEPTLYGRTGGNPRVTALIGHARRLGYEYIRLVTNGLLVDECLADPAFEQLDEISFSIDGDVPAIHDALRGTGTFARSVRNLQLAKQLGFTVHITTCVHRGNVGVGADGRLLVERAIRWAETLRVDLINFHPLFKMEIPRDTWSGETDISPQQWRDLYRALRSQIDRGEFRIPVRLPQRFVSSEEFERDPQFYGYCPVKMRERIEVHPNGQIHICALHNGTPIHIARFRRSDDSVWLTWNALNNEIACYRFESDVHHPCAVIQRSIDGLVPLCISFKPEQDEYVWKRLNVHRSSGSS